MKEPVNIASGQSNGKMKVAELSEDQQALFNKYLDRASMLNVQLRMTQEALNDFILSWYPNKKYTVENGKLMLLSE